MKKMYNIFQTLTGCLKGISFVRRSLLSVLLMALSFSAVGADFYGLFPDPLVNVAFSQMKGDEDGSRIVEWSLEDCLPLTKIVLKRSDYKLSVNDQKHKDLTHVISIPCVTPHKVFTLNKPTSFKEMGFLFEKDLKGKKASLTFKRNGKPDSLFIGVEPVLGQVKFAPPTIKLRSGNDIFFCRGELHSFVASVPEGFRSDEVKYNWYVDGEKMTGRHDRWFDTYSRTNWADGEHYVQCEVYLDGEAPSPKGTFNVVQLPGANCEFSVKAIPYWGAECEDDTSGADLRYNYKSEWGSFVITPMEEYVHFYLEVINRKVSSFTVTNDEAIPNFKLINKSEADQDFMFFSLPVNMKAQAKEPYTTHKVYFRFEGDNINYSMTPYAFPEVTASPDTVEICENSFIMGEPVTLNAEQVGLAKDTYGFQWYYSTEINGKYEPVENATSKVFTPYRVGYYKAEVSDGVFSAMSAPVVVKRKTDHCVSVEIIGERGIDYVCAKSKLYLHSSISGSNYTYQWKVGKLDGSELKNINGATNAEYVAAANKKGEAYFLEVKYAGQVVLSKPFVVREIAKLPASKNLEITALPLSVCQGRSVNIFANLELKEKERRESKSKSQFIYELYRKGFVGNELVKSELSNKTSLHTTQLINESATYYVDLVGCDGRLRSKSEVTINVVNDDRCSSSVFYVKPTGNDYNDGLSWGTAFQTLKHAIEVAFEIRNSDLYKSQPIEIHLAAGTYASSNGYDFPDNTTIYGGYDEEPVDGTLSATLRNPKSPANIEGKLTTLTAESTFSRIVKLTDRKDVKFVGICFNGEAISNESWLNGRAIYADGSSVTLDSCWVTNFYMSVNQGNPITAVSMLKRRAERTDFRPTLIVRNTTFSANKGGDIGSCIGLLSDCDVEIANSVFNNNTTKYSGGVALLSFNASPKVNVLNSTFYDNTCQNGIGYYGRTVIRMVGGNPELNIYSSTVCGRFYKEDGKLRIYNSIIECAGRADVYENNYPKVSTFVDDDQKDLEKNDKPFLANFRGGIGGKLQSKGGLTQVLVPANMLEIVSQAGAPHKLTPTDQRGFPRNEMASTYGAYDLDHSAFIRLTYEACPDYKNTEGSFVASVVGLRNPKYQWVNNYSNVEGATTKDVEKLGIGTYWLEATGEDASGRVITISSNEIRISDICEEPGVFFVKTPLKGGNDLYAGTTWNQAYATVDKAIEAAMEYKKREGESKPVSIHVAEGVYSPSDDKGFAFQKSGLPVSNIVVYGGYPANASNNSVRMPKKVGAEEGYSTVFTAASPKGKIFSSNSKTKGLTFVGIQFVGTDSVPSSTSAISIDGGAVTMDSCEFRNFRAGKKSDVNPLISVTKTSELTLRNCVVRDNSAWMSAGVYMKNKGNKSVVKLVNVTFMNNVSEGDGGAAIYVDGASADIRMYNSTMYGNACVSGENDAAGTVRLKGGESSLKVYNSTLMGTYYRESGSLKFYHSMVEAVGGYYVNANSYVAYPRLEKLADKMPEDQKRAFRSNFEDSLSYGGFTPVLKPLKRDGSTFFSRVSSLVSIDGVDLSKDQRGEARPPLSILGACEFDAEKEGTVGF